MFSVTGRIIDNKVIGLIAPCATGGKIGLFSGAWVGKAVIIMELIRNIIVEQLYLRYSVFC